MKQEIQEVEKEIEELEGKLEVKRKRLKDLKSEKLQKEQFLMMLENSGNQEEVLVDASKDEIKEIIEESCSMRDDWRASLEEIVSVGKTMGFTESSIRERIDELRRKGELIEPAKNEFRLV